MTTEALSQVAAGQRRVTARQRWAARLARWSLGTNAALVFGFLYLPVLILIIFSFNSTRSVAVFSDFSTEWYLRLAANGELLQAARNSLLIGLVATAGSTAIGTLTALAMDRYRFRLRTVFDANLYLPIVIPEIVMGIALLLFFNQGLFPLLARLGVRASTGLITITLAHIAFDIPFVYVIVRARLADFDRTLEEAAQDLGADEWRTFTRVTLPLLMPGIIGGALMAFTLSLDDYLITAFTKGVGSQTMPLYIYSLVRKGVTPEINALSTALLIGSMGLVGLSLTAQAGGPLFTRGMALGAAAGSILPAAAGLVGRLANGAFSPLDLLRLLPLLLLWLAGRGLRDWLADLREANLAGRALAVFALLASASAAFISVLLLVG
ncbi:MAG: ABC transporter permease [Anaerolineales bacterium]|nr:ABC transporter permease [Anaerolineales bacterium]